MQQNPALSLRDAWQQATAPLRDNQHAEALIDALCAGRFSFAREAWHAREGQIAHELLLRVWHPDGRPVDRARAFAGLMGEQGLAALGPFLALGALAKTKPVAGDVLSINIPISTAASPSFWSQLDNSMNGHRAEDIIFEILEHETDFTVDDTLLRAAQDKGFRFALDDFIGSAQDQKRLQAFAPYLSFVKLDGALVQADLAGNPVMKDTIAQLRRDHPDLKIVAEFVANPAQAHRLFALGVTAVQGYHLKFTGPMPSAGPA